MCWWFFPSSFCYVVGLLEGEVARVVEEGKKGGVRGICAEGVMKAMGVKGFDSL